MERRIAQMQAEQSAQRVLQLDELVSARRAVLLGDPGSGKTTTVRYVAYTLAAGDGTYVGQGVLGKTPVLIRIAEYAKAFDGNLHVIDYIERKLFSRPAFGAFARREIESDNCVILLDGLDEVPDRSLRIAVTKRIEGLVAEYGQNHFLVSSRIVGYEGSALPGDYEHATIQALRTEDQRRFVTLWYESMRTFEQSAQVNYEEQAANLIEVLTRKPQIARMAANPLLLTILVVMHSRGTKLPSRRVQVYDIATDTLIEHWTAQRGTVDLDTEEMVKVLGPIARHIIDGDVTGVIAKARLVPLFTASVINRRDCSTAEAERLGREWLTALSEQSGLFLERGLDGANEPVYGFLHLTFGEYLAAKQLEDEWLSETFTLKEYIYKSNWREPLLLLAGRLSQVHERFVTALTKEVLAF